MSIVTRIVVALRGWVAGRPFERAARDPKGAQQALLLQIINENRQTAFGRDHAFAACKGPKDFATHVPIRDYEGLRPYIDRLIAGEQAVLTQQPPFMYASTSGTTNQPKLVPVTDKCFTTMGGLMRLWISRCQQHFPGMLKHKILTVTSPSVEGYTERKVKIGSVSGLTRERAPAMVQKLYAIPYELVQIEDYDLRYFLSMRFALATKVSALVTPNPSTILRLYEVTQTYTESLLVGIESGSLSIPDELMPDGLSAEQTELLNRLEDLVQPCPERASQLRSLVDREGALLFRDAWPELAVIACWLGASAGVQAKRFREFCHPKQGVFELGLRATEATMTVPVSLDSGAGVLALHANYYEFIAEEQIEWDDPKAYGAHELEVGRRYYILLTTTGGLYRYDINDIVEVVGFYHQAPMLAFVRKGRDMANITGEKLHVNQVIEAGGLATTYSGVEWTQMQMIPDVDDSTYDLLVEFVPEAPGAEAVESFRSAFDKALQVVNVEYSQKRKSQRLGRPRLYQMRGGWEARCRKAHVAADGRRRDSQYKWKVIALDWDPGHRDEVLGALEEQSMMFQLDEEQRARLSEITEDWPPDAY